MKLATSADVIAYEIVPALGEYVNDFYLAAIVDEVDEKVSFLWDDGTNDFETLSFMSLEREEGGGMYKKVINMMTKGR